MLHVAIFSSLRKFIESSIGNILFDVIYKTLIIIAKSQTTSAVSKVLLPVALLASVSGVMTSRNNPIICRAAQGVKVYSVLLSPSLLSEKMSFTFWQKYFWPFSADHVLEREPRGVVDLHRARSHRHKGHDLRQDDQRSYHQQRHHPGVDVKTLFHISGCIISTPL